MTLDSLSAPPFAQRIVVYALAIVAAVAVAVAGVRWLGFRGEEMLLLEGAILLLVAATGRAPRLLGAVGRAGWFSAVTSDRVLRSILIILAVAIAVAVLVRRALFPTA
jgi:hypothetical protein